MGDGAWAAAGILGPLMAASFKDNYPDRAIVYMFLLGIHVLGAGFVFSFLHEYRGQTC
jgi:MFS transporter, OFA family, oxalate/formate antiporter